MNAGKETVERLYHDQINVKFGWSTRTKNALNGGPTIIHRQSSVWRGGTRC